MEPFLLRCSQPQRQTDVNHIHFSRQFLFLLVQFDELSAVESCQNDCRVDVPVGDLWDHRRIRDEEVLDAENSKMVVHDAVSLFLRHGCAADPVRIAHHCAIDPGVEICINEACSVGIHGIKTIREWNLVHLSHWRSHCQESLQGR